MEFFGRKALPPDREFLDSSVFIDKSISQFMQRKQVEDDLLRLRAVMDAAPDLFFVVDPEALRFLYINEVACKVQGLTLEQYLQLPPWVASGISREELVTLYDAAIAKPGKAITSETYGRVAGGRYGWFETQRRALHVDGRWLIVIGSQAGRAVGIAAGSLVRRAERHQRGDHAQQVARGFVWTRVRRRCARRQIHDGGGARSRCRHGLDTSRGGQRSAGESAAQGEDLR